VEPTLHRTLALPGAALALLLAGCAGAGPAGPAVQAEAETGERLLAAPPNGWRLVARQESEKLRIAEFVAPDGIPDAWTEKVRFEAVVLPPPVPEPGPYLDDLAREQRTVCEDLAARALYDGGENGYPTAVRVLFCPLHELHGDGRVVMMKAIAGEESFYLIVREAAVAPFAADQPPEDFPPERIAGWSVYLRAIRLCDGTDAHPCPDAEG
jgi:hypothetical protein